MTSPMPSTLQHFPWLVADVGGTNARFGWVAGPGSAVAQVHTLAVADHTSLADAALAYLHWRVGQGPAQSPGEPDPPDTPNTPDQPRRAAFAVATAVAGDTVAFTNSPWSFSRQAVRAALGLELLLVMNDFEALALSLPRLGAAQLRADQPLSLPPSGTLAVIGPGTGLGVGAVTQTAHGWLALPGEGGHVTLAPADGLESAVLAQVRRSFEHVSAERLLSGIGLPVLYRALCTVQGWRSDADTARAIVDTGVAGTDPACAQTLEMFCALLGGFAGNVALTVGARGGVYIGGGIVPRLGQRFFASPFRARFEAKGRFQPYLAAIPTAVITDTLAALAGAALAIEQSVGN